ncbi:hypothetical protein TNCV_3001521 [Trichonephila clavipes]|nr:hypothetical protein TNCV_3001521 [Trichonephila clavipes]
MRVFFEDTLFQLQSEFVQTLKATIKDFKPDPFSYHSKQKSFIFKDLKDYSHVFIHTDSVRRSLQLPYHGPYKVINRSDEVFTLFIKDSRYGKHLPEIDFEILIFLKSPN